MPKLTKQEMQAIVNDWLGPCIRDHYHYVSCVDVLTSSLAKLMVLADKQGQDEVVELLAVRLAQAEQLWGSKLSSMAIANAEIDRIMAKS